MRHWGIQVLDTINDDREIQHVRYSEKTWGEYLRRYEAPRYVVQILDYKGPDAGGSIVADNQGSEGAVRRFNPIKKEPDYARFTDLPSRIGETIKITAHGNTLSIKKKSRNLYFARVTGEQRVQWGDRKEILEDLQHFLDVGSLPPAKVSFNPSQKQGEFEARLVKSYADPPDPRANPSSEFRAGAAKAFWADLYITEVEELRDEYPELHDELSPGPGGEWMDYVPEVPWVALADAEAFERAVNAANNIDSIDRLIDVAARADNVNPEDIDVEDFGYYLAMPALGHGVSWFDDHGDFDLKLPHWEQNVGTHNAMYDLLEELKKE